MERLTAQKLPEAVNVMSGICGSCELGECGRNLSQLFLCALHLSDFRLLT